MLRGPFSVTVDYTKNLLQMLAMGGYRLPRGIHKKDYPVVGSGNVPLDMYIYFAGQRLPYKDAVDDLDDLRLRPAKIEELLAFGDAYPNEQQKYPIIGLGNFKEQLFFTAPFIYHVYGNKVLDFIFVSGPDIEWPGIYKGWGIAAVAP